MTEQKDSMIKGCERRMIKIENTDSDLFESAYFIIRQNVQLPKKKRRDDMLREAARIVSDKTVPTRKRDVSSRRLWLAGTYNSGPQRLNILDKAEALVLIL